VLAEKPEYQPLLAMRIEMIIDRMKRSPVLAAESYPDECWLFDHAVALAAIKVADWLDGTDHSDFCRQWVAMARTKLIHPSTGLCGFQLLPERSAYGWPGRLQHLVGGALPAIGR